MVVLGFGLRGCGFATVCKCNDAPAKRRAIWKQVFVYSIKTTK